MVFKPIYKYTSMYGTYLSEETGLPYGWKFVRHGNIRKGEYFLSNNERGKITKSLWDRDARYPALLIITPDLPDSWVFVEHRIPYIGEWYLSFHEKQPVECRGYHNTNEIIIAKDTSK